MSERHLSEGKTKIMLPGNDRIGAIVRVFNVTVRDGHVDILSGFLGEPVGDSAYERHGQIHSFLYFERWEIETEIEGGFEQSIIPDTFDLHNCVAGQGKRIEQALLVKNIQ